MSSSKKQVIPIKEKGISAKQSRSQYGSKLYSNDARGDLETDQLGDSPYIGTTKKARF